MDKQLKNLIDTLNARNNVDGWLINHTVTESHEFFFIKEKMDMNRSKYVKKTQLTVYRNFEENGKKYKGSASTTLPPDLSEDKLSSALDDLILGASFVKNADYNLVQKQPEDAPAIPCNVAGKDPMKLATQVYHALYSQDTFEDGRINSGELFLETTEHRLMNSLGVDQTYTSYFGEIEMAVDWLPKSAEPVEFFDAIHFSDIDEARLSAFAKNALEIARWRAEAKPLSGIKDIPVLLTNRSVAEFFTYFTAKANAEMVYQQYSSIKPGDALQGANITGDAVTLHMQPIMKGSIASRSLDSDGVYLNACTLYQNGVLKQYHGTNRFSQYLNIPVTGHIGNIVIDGGKASAADLKASPHLEIIAFSDFQMNDITGEFGGEIRIGKYFDSKNVHLVTGGSISGSFKDVAQSMQLSRETHQVDSMICPIALKLNDVTIANAE